MAWHYGPPERWRNVLARVVHASLRREGDWLLGCRFETPLEESELRDFLERVGAVRSY